MMEIKQIISDIKSGKLDRDLDEAYAGGFWDLAGQTAGADSDLQETIYGLLWETYEQSVLTNLP
ncbi:MAG TPA: hypothetical protein VGO47_08945 [Chlamydiales bacterium]|nr:hypothetical protein [Chlamydiales bacterium]